MREATPDAQRSYYRHIESGEKGYRVSRDGRDFIKIDRPGDPVERVFRAADWLPEIEVRPMPPMALARIAWAADRELRTALGILGGKDWINLPERERIAWMQEGPSEPPRRALYDAIMGELRAMNAAV